MHELSPLEVHNLVKEKLRLKGISLNQRSMPKPRSPKQVNKILFTYKF